MARKKSPAKPRRGTSPFSRWKRGAMGLVFSLAVLALAAGVAWHRNPDQTLPQAIESGRALLERPAAGTAPKPATATPSEPTSTEVARVLRVVDGDTLIVKMGAAEETVRLLNVDTPESVHREKAKNLPIGKKASDYTKERLENRQVRLEGNGREERDRYGRRLAYVITEGENFNLELVREGWSPYVTKYGKSKEQDAEFRRAEETARKKLSGIWGDPDYLAQMDDVKED